jgi:DNA-binding transcriptional LysR family regulator
MFDQLFRDRGLSLDRLRTFCMVAEAGGVTKAAAKNTSRQSQFSRQINELEEFFGVELMKRHGKGITLTAAGKRLANVAREIFLTLEDFNSNCKSEPQRFSIGAGDSLLQWLLFPKIGALQKALPNIGIDVYGLPSLEIVDGVTELRLDFGIVRRDAVTPAQKFQSLGFEKYALFVPRQLLGGKKPSTVSEVIAKIPLTTIAGEGRFRATLQRQARKAKLPLSFSLCCSTFPQAARALRSERYAAILPTIAADELDHERFATISVPFLESREICLIWNPRSARLRPQTTAVKDCLLKLLKLPNAPQP